MLSRNEDKEGCRAIEMSGPFAKGPGISTIFRTEVSELIEENAARLAGRGMTILTKNC